MANKKVPRRDEYDSELGLIKESLPSNYAGIIQHSRPDLNKRRIYELQRVAKESIEARQLVAS